MSFEPPSASSAVWQGLDFGLAIPVASDCKAAFDAADEQPHNQDPSRCKALLRFPDGTVFWSSKMAIDADGPAAGRTAQWKQARPGARRGPGQNGLPVSEWRCVSIVRGRSLPGRAGWDRRRSRPSQQDRRGFD